MIKIGIIANKSKDKDLQFASNLSEKIVKLGGDFIFDEDSGKSLGLDLSVHNVENIIKNADVVFTLGGDGTLLRAVRSLNFEEKPILGINLGTLGFLTQVDREHSEKAVERIINGDYRIEKRMTIAVKIYNSTGELLHTDIALNDAAITREYMKSLVKLKMYINNEFVDTISGDGLIIATPTGSTAYSMSAGGPLVDPQLNNIILTPICPHNLYSKAIVTSGDYFVRVTECGDEGHEATISIDGQKGYKFGENFVIECTRSEKSINLIKLSNKYYFNVLRTKIYDVGESLRKDEI